MMTTLSRIRTVILASVLGCCACQSARANTTPVSAPTSSRPKLVVSRAAPSNATPSETATPEATLSESGSEDETNGNAHKAWRQAPTGPNHAWLSLGRIDPKGRWLYFCRANDKFDTDTLTRRTRGARSNFVDDTFTPYFSSAKTTLAPVDALLASSPSGRYVALARGGAAELLDVQTGKSVDLSSRDFDIRGDVLPGDWRSIAFSPKGDKVAFLIHVKQPRVIVRSLESGAEAEVLPVGEIVWRVGFDASGQYVVLDEVPEDTNHNGKLTWPFGASKLRDTLCQSNIPAFAAYSPTGDTAQKSIAPVTGGKAHWVPGFVSGLGHSVIVKSASGELTAVDGSHSRAFGSRNCDAQVVAIAPEHERMLVGCQNASGRSELELDSTTRSHKLDLDVPYSKIDWLVPDYATYAVVYPGARTVLVDWARDRVVPLEDRDQVLAQGPAGVLVRRGSTLLLFGSELSQARPLIEGIADTARIVMGNGVAAIGNVIASAIQGRVLGTLEQPALAIDSEGCGLVSLSESAGTTVFARGPLRWACPGK